MQFRLLLQYVSAGVLLAMGISGCDRQHSEQSQQAPLNQSTPQNAAISTQQEEDQPFASTGVSLTQVAGQATLPHVEHSDVYQPSADDLIYAGRYHVRIPCSDPFAGCVNNEKEAEYIINLMNDGSVYWTNTSFGRLSSEASKRQESKIEQTCKQVHWHANTPRKELIIRCDAADVNFYYDVQPDGKLAFNLEKIWNGDNGRNQKFFKEYPFPQKNYVFERIASQN